MVERAHALPRRRGGEGPALSRPPRRQGRPTTEIAATIGAPAGPLTVEQYAKRWIDERRPL
jgi:hypothetical protein